MGLEQDIVLMQRVIQGDQTALADLYQRYGRLVYSLAIRVLQNSTLAEEVTQDTFMKLWNRPEAWDSSKGRLSTWLLTVTRYTAIDRLRKETHHRKDEVLDEVLNMPAHDDVLTDPLFQDGQLLRALLVQLAPEQLQLNEMAFFQGMTHTELAEKLNLPLGTVKTRLRAGLKKLKALWDSQNPP